MITATAYLIFAAWIYNWQFPWSFDPSQIPSPITTLKQIIFLMITEDLHFYITHRICHTKHKYFPIYQWVHSWHHDYSMTVSISNQYFHPVEFILVALNGFLLGMYILGARVHFFTFVIWGLVRIMGAHDVHSGYEFPWNPLHLIPFTASPTYHDYHHSKNTGNFGSLFTVWDSLFDTNKDYLLKKNKE